MDYVPEATDGLKICVLKTKIMSHKLERQSYSFILGSLTVAKICIFPDSVFGRRFSVISSRVPLCFAISKRNMNVDHLGVEIDVIDLWPSRT